MTEAATWRSWVSGPKSARLPEFVRKTAIEYGCAVTIEVEKRWLTETVFFTAKGTHVLAFEHAIVSTITAALAAQDAA